jgi:hypothetical protein
MKKRHELHEFKSWPLNIPANTRMMKLVKYV